MQNDCWKVGRLAERTGLSVRTLHWYDEIGLLKPSHRTGSGHRLYTDQDITRLQQIRSLRRLGFSLEEIGRLLDKPDYSLPRVMRMHLERLREQISREQQLCRRLEAIATRLDGWEEVTTDEFIKTIREIEMIEELSKKYYTDEQRQELDERRKAVGEEQIRQAETEWADLIAAVRVEMDKGTDPSTEPVRKLAAKWRSLIAEFTGGNTGIARSLGKMWQNEPQVGQRYAIDQAMMEYIAKSPSTDEESH